MKYKYLLLLLSVIFLASSCSINKRKYLPGYSFERVAKEPKTVYHKEPSTNRIATGNNTIKPIATHELTIHKILWNANPPTSFNINIKHFVDYKGALLKTAAAATREAAWSNPKYDGERLSDTARARLAGMVCKQAKASQHLGMLGLTLTLFSFGLWAMVQVLKNSGIAWATNMLAVAIVSTGAVAGGILAVLAIIFAIAAFHRIHQERGKYTGTSKAFSGIVFAVILLAILGYLALIAL